MVVASVLMSMGMMMMSPVMIALPFKLMLFVLVDGWHLIPRLTGGQFRHMTPELVMDIGRQAVEMTLLLAAPLLLAALLIGLIVSVFQAATQINEQTLSLHSQAGRGIPDPAPGRPVDAGADGRLRAPTVRKHSSTGRLGQR
jgi:hypothetical protein